METRLLKQIEELKNDVKELKELIKDTASDVNDLKIKEATRAGRESVKNPSALKTLTIGLSTASVLVTLILAILNGVTGK
jgi:hypothetical protein